MNLKMIGSLILAALAAIFILQNAKIVEMHFLFRKVSMSRAPMFALLVLTGGAVGCLLHGHVLHRAQRRDTKNA